MVQYKEALDIISSKNNEKQEKLNKLSKKDKQDFEMFFTGSAMKIKTRKVKFPELWKLDDDSLKKLFKEKDESFNERTIPVGYMTELRYVTFFKNIMSFEMYVLLVSQLGFSGLIDYVNFAKDFYKEEFTNEKDINKRDEMVFNIYDKYQEKDKEKYFSKNCFINTSLLS